jgi:N-carbamoylputrescine amidase
LSEKPGIAVGEIRLDPARKVQTAPRAYGRWALPVPWYAFLWPLTQTLGERRYRKNPQRAALARQLGSLPANACQ